MLELPDAVYAALGEVARASGTTPADWIAAHLPSENSANGENLEYSADWIDRDFLASIENADDSVSLEAVRQAMAKIPGRLADDIREERDKR